MPRRMTSEDVDRFREQESFSWNEFAGFEGEDIGSGLYIFKYDLVDGGYLLVSGSSMEMEPQRIIFYHSDGQREEIKFSPF